MSVKDPVCGMEIEPKDAAGTSDYQGQKYYFCSEHCKQAFDKEPQKYIKPDEHSHHHHH
jgi:YHS domain-containing protein